MRELLKSKRLQIVVLMVIFVVGVFVGWSVRAYWVKREAVDGRAQEVIATLTNAYATFVGKRDSLIEFPPDRYRAFSSHVKRRLGVFIAAFWIFETPAGKVCAIVLPQVGDVRSALQARSDESPSMAVLNRGSQHQLVLMGPIGETLRERLVSDFLNGSRR